MSRGESSDAFQVWHSEGDTFRKVAEVEAGGVLEAIELTQNRESPDDPHEGERWIDQAGVIVAIEANPRSTGYGDIIIASDGREYEITLRLEGDTPSFGVHATTAIAEQGYRQWFAEQAELQSVPESSPAEQAALFQEWRDDASQRELAGKGVDYSDAPYAEPTGQSYAEQRAAAAASAKFHRPPGLDAPEL